MKFRYQKFVFGHHDPTKPLVARPYIPVYLLASSKRTVSPYFALLDSGADSVLFPADLAAEVGIDDIADGRFEPAIGIAGQKADVFYHGVQLQVLGAEMVLPMEVGFSKELLIPILGRTFFRHFNSVIFAETASMFWSFRVQ